MSTTLAQALRRAATIANRLNAEAKTFTEPELKEFINTALENASQELAENGVTRILKQSDITVTAGSTTVTLPTDLQTPVRMWEKGSDNIWTIMLKRGVNLPLNAETVDRLIWWDWRDNAIHIVAASATVTVRLLYWADLASFTMPSDSVSLPGLTNTLVYGAVALAAAIVAPDRADWFESKAQQALETYINIDVRTTHSTPSRRLRRRFGRPFWR